VYVFTTAIDIYSPLHHYIPIILIEGRRLRAEQDAVPAGGPRRLGDNTPPGAREKRGPHRKQTASGAPEGRGVAK